MEESVPKTDFPAFSAFLRILEPNVIQMTQGLVTENDMKPQDLTENKESHHERLDQ